MNGIDRAVKRVFMRGVVTGAVVTAAINLVLRLTEGC